MLDAMLPHDSGGTGTNAEAFAEHAEEPTLLARVRTSRKQDYDFRRYHLRHRYVTY